MIRPSPGALVWPAAMIVWGPAFTSARHSHHCVQLLMAIDGTLLVRSGPTDKWTKCGAVLVRPDARHEVDARGTNVLLIAFVDAESELGAALADRIDGGISSVPVKQVARWRAALGPKITEARVEGWVKKELRNGSRAVKIDPRVRRAIKYLRDGKEQMAYAKPSSPDSRPRASCMSLPNLLGSHCGHTFFGCVCSAHRAS